MSKLSDLVVWGLDGSRIGFIAVVALGLESKGVSSVGGSAGFG